MINPQTSGIVSPFVTAILFGLYLASFAHCARWLLFEDEGWKVRKKVNRALATTTLVIFFLSAVAFSMTAALGVGHGIPAYRSDDIPASVWVVIILDSNAFHMSILIIIDGVLIHRCWIVFSKNWFIISLPLALWCSCLICATISFCCDIVILLPTDSMIHSRFRAQICGIPGRPRPYTDVEFLAFYTCNIVVSIYTTSALVFKIWCAAKNDVGTNRLHRTSRILTESGILYTLSSGFFLAYLIENQIANSKPTVTNDSYFLSDLLSSIAGPVSTYIPGIAFNLIIIRVGEQRARGEDTWVDSKDTSKALSPSELLNHPVALSQQEVESTDLGSWPRRS